MMRPLPSHKNVWLCKKKLASLEATQSSKLQLHNSCMTMKTGVGPIPRWQKAMQAVMIRPSPWHQKVWLCKKKVNERYTTESCIDCCLFLKWGEFNLPIQLSCEIFMRNKLEEGLRAVYPCTTSHFPYQSFDNSITTAMPGMLSLRNALGLLSRIVSI